VSTSRDRRGGRNAEVGSCAVPTVVLLGLSGPAVMPRLLAAMHELIPSESIAFFWDDERGALAGFSPEYAIPEILANLCETLRVWSRRRCR